MGFSLGIGLTNDCTLNCAHCYRDTDRINNLSLEQVQRICNAVKIDAAGMGTGESVLNPQFKDIVRYFKKQDVKLSMASNGFTLMTIPEEILQAFHDVEVSIDFPTQLEQDEFRGTGNWRLVHRAIERCLKAGVEVSILATMMRLNYHMMDRMVELARQNQVNLRVNAYQSVKTDEYRLSYVEFWEGYRRLLSTGKLVSCSEPVVRSVLGLENVQSPCGHRSIRINPIGQILPCVYWPTDASRTPTIEDLSLLGEEILGDGSFHSAREVPSAAVDCLCQGGCASRRALNHNLNAHDDYCPMVQGETLTLKWEPAPAKDLMRSGNVCTTIVA